MLVLYCGAVFHSFSIPLLIFGGRGARRGDTLGQASDSGVESEADSPGSARGGSLSVLFTRVAVAVSFVFGDKKERFKVDAVVGASDRIGCHHQLRLHLAWPDLASCLGCSHSRSYGVWGRVLLAARRLEDVAYVCVCVRQSTRSYRISVVFFAGGAPSLEGMRATNK